MTSDVKWLQHKAFCHLPLGGAVVSHHARRGAGRHYQVYARTSAYPGEERGAHP